MFDHMPYDDELLDIVVPYEEPVPHPVLMGHVSEHMFDHMPYDDELLDIVVPYEEPVPIVW
jgi:hypothetical protein